MVLTLPNGPEHLFAWLGAAKLGAVVAPLHAQWAADEVRRALAQLRPKMIVGDLEPASALSGVPTLGRDEFGRLAEAGAAPIPEVEETPAEAPAELLFTSGTTGLPKAAVQSFRTLLLTGEAFATWLGLGPEDRLFTCLPLAHINARCYSTMGALAAGATLVLEERFSASRFWSWMAESGATQVNTIGAMLRILLQAPPSELDRAHRLRLVYTAPALGAELHGAFERRFGVRLVVGYGSTECTFGFIQPVDVALDDPTRNLAALGRPRRHPDVRWECGWRLVDPVTGLDAAPPASASASPPPVGEIWLKGPTLFAGYFENEEATRSVLTPDGWLRTGDLATRDAHDDWTFVGRIKEMIRRRGENVSPLEIEEVLLAHPGVREAAVIGVPSPLGEEEIAAFVVQQASGTLSREDLERWCAERLARFKVPAEWRFVDALPRTATNRVAKGELLASRGS